jgi:hypothetical protein
MSLVEHCGLGAPGPFWRRAICTVTPFKATVLIATLNDLGYPKAILSGAFTIVKASCLM